MARTAEARGTSPMNPSDVAAWVSAFCALVSLGSAAVAWWRTNLSRRAREAAETARDASQRNLVAMEKIARSLDGPPFTIRSSEFEGFVLTSNRPESLTIEDWENVGDFDVGTPTDFPKELESFGSLRIDADWRWLNPQPVEVVLRVTQLGTVRVAIPGPQG